MRFKMELDGVEYAVDINAFNGKTTFSADCVEGSFESWPALELAVERLRKKQRKDFVNTTAYVLSGWREKVEAVTVLSIQSSTKAWIINQWGRRELVERSKLFASSTDLSGAIRKKEQLEKAKSQVFDKVPRWMPKRKGSPAARAMEALKQLEASKP